MTEAEVVEQLVQHTNILLVGLGVYFTVLSVYLAGLNYVLAEESVSTRFIAFFFVSVMMVMISAIMLGAQSQHAGLIARLEEIDRSVGLTAAGRSFLANARAGISYGGGELTIDEAVVYLVWGAAALTYLALMHLTFFYKWRPSAKPAATAA